jgi:hypothetical protein
VEAASFKPLFPRPQDYLIKRLISLLTDLIKRLISFLCSKKLDSHHDYPVNSKVSIPHGQCPRVVPVTKVTPKRCSPFFMLQQYLVVGRLLVRIRLLLCLLVLRKSWLHLRLVLYVPCQLVVLLRLRDPQSRLEGS